MRGQLQLALHLCTRQTARLELARAIGIAGLGRVLCLLLFLFLFVHPLGESGFRVDEPFSSVTHTSDYTELGSDYGKCPGAVPLRSGAFGRPREVATPGRSNGHDGL